MNNQSLQGGGEKTTMVTSVDPIKPIDETPGAEIAADFSTDASDQVAQQLHDKNQQQLNTPPTDNIEDGKAALRVLYKNFGYVVVYDMLKLLGVKVDLSNLPDDRTLVDSVGEFVKDHDSFMNASQPAPNERLLGFQRLAEKIKTETERALMPIAAAVAKTMLEGKTAVKWGEEEIEKLWHHHASKSTDTAAIARANISAGTSGGDQAKANAISSVKSAG